mmetsp:Transcript_10929/g.14872  ORF Transcript_10929/g.14872 Transcript_10929/m.14872 type:complete len:680 (+) Transcript_10929:227-2266(+)
MGPLSCHVSAEGYVSVVTLEDVLSTIHLVSKLSLKTLARCELVSRSWKRAIREGSQFWRVLDLSSLAMELKPESKVHVLQQIIGRGNYAAHLIDLRKLAFSKLPLLSPALTLCTHLRVLLVSASLDTIRHLNLPPTFTTEVFLDVRSPGEDSKIGNLNFDPNGTAVVKGITCKCKIEDDEYNVMSQTEFQGRMSLFSKGLMKDLAACSSSLTSLSLSDYAFVEEKFSELLDALQLLSNLSSLTLSNVLFAGDYLVEGLMVSYNDDGFLSPSVLMSRLPAAILPLDRLTKLDLSQNGIGDENIHVLADFLGGSKSLTSLNLIDNPITVKGGRVLLDSFRLNLDQWESFNNIPLKQLRRNQVPHLNLSGILNEDHGTNALAECMKFASNIETLNLSCVDMRFDGLSEILVALRQSGTQIALDLDMNYNLGEPELSLQIGTFMSSNSTITHLNLVQSKMAFPFIPIMFRWLASNSTLVSIVVSFGEDRSYASYQSHGPDVEEASFAAIGNFLKSNTSVKTFNLCFDTSRNFHSGSSLIEGLAKNSSLTTLGINAMSCNGVPFFRDEAHFYTSLEKVLKVNTTLKSLELQGHGMKLSDVSALIRGLLKNTSLLSLDLSNQSIDAMTNETTSSQQLVSGLVGDLLTLNKSLTSLNLSGNLLSSEVKDALNEGMKSNTSIEALIL